MHSDKIVMYDYDS